MKSRYRPTGLVFFTLLAAIATPLHGEVPGELGAADLTGIRAAHQVASWCDGLTGENPVELDASLSNSALRLAGEAAATVPSKRESAYLKPFNTGAGDFFATVAVSGDTVVVGAPFEDSAAVAVNGDGRNNKAIHSGAAYVFVKTSDQWVQQAYLKASDGVAGDQFGFSVAISGDTVVVGAYAAGDVTTTPAIPATATTPAKPATTTKTQYVGAAYVFTRSAAKWTQQQILKPTVNSVVGDAFGYSVAVAGDTAVVGAIGESTTKASAPGAANVVRPIPAGAAFVFFRDGKTWSQQGYLKANNPEANDLFGMAVAVSGNTVVVGAPNESGDGKGADGGQTTNLAKSAGAAYIFARKGTTWKARVYCKAGNAGAGDQFGRAVGISGERVIIGAPGESSAARRVDGNSENNSAVNAGAAYIFVHTKSGKWRQEAYLKARNSGAGDSFGFAVAISNETAVVGAMGEDSGGKDAGAAYVFTLSRSGWKPQPPLRASNRGAGDKLGFSVAVSGETVVCGALGEAGNSKSVNGDPSNNGAKDAGAGYIYEKIRPVGPAIVVRQADGNALVSERATVSFGDKASPLAVSKTFSIANDGNTPLTGINVAVVGANTADFTVDTTATATTVLAGKSTTFVVTFASTSTDPRTASVVIRSNDENKNQFSIALQGNGVGVPKIGLALADGTSLTDGGVVISFGEVRIGTSGVTKVFTISNPGKGILKNLKISTSGLNPKDFSVSSLGVTELAPGGTAAFRVTFAPTGIRTRLAKITVVSSDAVSGPFDINVSGVGLARGSRKKTAVFGLAEIVLGGPPSGDSAHSARSVTVIHGEKFLGLSVTKPTDGGPVGVIQVSPNLLDWYSGSQHTTVITDDATTLKVRDNTPITPETKRYIRVK